MVRLWDDTVDAHRQEVRDAVVAAAARLVADQGLRQVTMSRLAREADIGRATLYRHFPDLDAVLRAWHEAQIRAHLRELTAVRDRTTPAVRLAAVLEAYALLSRRSHGHHDAELEAFLHGDGQVDAARSEVRSLVSDLIADAARAGAVRGDAPPDELASYCIHAMNAAVESPSTAAVRRLVSFTLRGLGPER